MSAFISQEDGYFALTKVGAGFTVLLIIILLLATALIRSNSEAKEAKKIAKRMSVKQLVFSAVAIALGFALSYVKIFSMPWGGSITLCSMLFPVLIGYWYGPSIGITACLAYGFLQFVQDGGGYILSPLQACLDYIVAFGALGLSGLFSKSKNGLVKGYILAIVARAFFHTVGGYLYWMDYMPDNFPKSLAVIYPIAYNYSFIIAEAILTLIIISIPAVNNALKKVKQMAA